MENLLSKCPSCNTKIGQIHKPGCEIEICSACGKQRISCYCKGKHDPAFARWTGIWPGKAEAKFLCIDLNDFHANFAKVFFVKPKVKNNQSGHI
ncbi:MAG: hypothetical protein WAZ12_01885 [Candidatus Absconditicoccaceae bacterium]